MNLTKTIWEEKNIQPFHDYLKSLSKGEEKASWEKRIVNTSLPCLAVPSTEVDRIVREIYRGNYISFLDLGIWSNLTDTLINGKILAKIKDYDTQAKYLETYSQRADNWATIDCLKFNFTKDNINKYMDLSNRLLKSPHAFSRRLALIILLKMTSFCDCSDLTFSTLNTLKDEKEYYVNMAGAWLLCECMTKFRDSTLKYFENNSTNGFIINKAISKCRDSYRITPEDKKYLLQFKTK